VYYYRMSADHRLIFGGASYSQRFRHDIAGFVRRHLARVFPQLADVPLEFAWGGTLSITPNRLPYARRWRPGCSRFRAFRGWGWRWGRGWGGRRPMPCRRAGPGVGSACNACPRRAFPEALAALPDAGRRHDLRPARQDLISQPPTGCPRRTPTPSSL
jgi:hypothetical protein